MIKKKQGELNIQYDFHGKSPSRRYTVTGVSPFRSPLNRSKSPTSNTHFSSINPSKVNLSPRKQREQIKNLTQKKSPIKIIKHIQQQPFQRCCSPSKYLYQKESKISNFDNFINSQARQYETVTQKYHYQDRLESRYQKNYQYFSKGDSAIKAHKTTKLFTEILSQLKSQRKYEVNEKQKSDKNECFQIFENIKLSKRKSDRQDEKIDKTCIRQVRTIESITCQRKKDNKSDLFAKEKEIQNKKDEIVIDLKKTLRIQGEKTKKQEKNEFEMLNQSFARPQCEQKKIENLQNLGGMVMYESVYGQEESSYQEIKMLLNKIAKNSGKQNAIQNVEEHEVMVSFEKLKDSFSMDPYL